MRLILFIFSAFLLSVVSVKGTSLDRINMGRFFSPVLWGLGIPKERATAYFYDPEERRIRYGWGTENVFACEDECFRFKIPEKSLPIPDDKGIFIFYPTCGLFLSPKDITEKLEALSKTEAYLRFQEEALREEVPFSNFVSHFTQQGGRTAVVDKKYPVASYLRFIFPSVYETNSDFAEHRRVISEFNTLFHSLVRWVYRRTDDKKYPETHGPRGTQRAVYDLSKDKGISLSEGRVLYGYRRNGFNFWVYSLDSILQKEGLGTFASCTVFETSPEMPIFIILRYQVKGDAQSFKDILISCNPEQREKETIEYFGVISTFDVREDRRISPPKVPAYGFDSGTRTIFYSVPIEVY
ncbi:MAG: hypothetical protein K6B46_03040 [Opitutales bacterium]|nr:hypothetical protein [Opitutales bacterium]